MKHIRYFFVAFILTFMLAFSALAGEIECGVVAPPPPPQQMESVAGDIHCGITTSETSNDETPSVDPMADFTLSILQSVLALF